MLWWKWAFTQSLNSGIQLNFFSDFFFLADWLCDTLGAVVLKKRVCRMLTRDWLTFQKVKSRRVLICVTQRHFWAMYEYVAVIQLVEGTLHTGCGRVQYQRVAMIHIVPTVYIKSSWCHFIANIYIYIIQTVKGILDNVNGRMNAFWHHEISKYRHWIIRCYVVR